MQVVHLRPELATAVKAVRAAIGAIAERFDASETLEKGRLDITTGTDLRSQAIIQAILGSEHPGIALVAEEAGLDHPVHRATYWLVDPICGTQNFVSHIPLYCVNVALVEDGRVVLGVVGDAALDEVWVAQRDRGAWAEHAGTLFEVAVDKRCQTVALDPGRPGGAADEKAARVVAAVIRTGRWEVRTLGTSLDLAYLAAGRLAAVWHFSRIPPLHFAAGTLLAVEAGAVVTDDRGIPWTLESTSLVAAANPTVHSSLLALQMG